MAIGGEYLATAIPNNYIIDEQLSDLGIKKKINDIISVNDQNNYTIQPPENLKISAGTNGKLTLYSPLAPDNYNPINDNSFITKKNLSDKLNDIGIEEDGEFEVYNNLVESCKIIAKKILGL